MPLTTVTIEHQIDRSYAVYVADDCTHDRLFSYQPQGRRSRRNVLVEARVYAQQLGRRLGLPVIHNSGVAASIDIDDDDESAAAQAEYEEWLQKLDRAEAARAVRSAPRKRRKKP